MIGYPTPKYKQANNWHLGAVWFTAFTRHSRCGAATKVVAGVASVAAATTVVKIYTQGCCGVAVADLTYTPSKHQLRHCSSHKYGVASEGGQPNSPLMVSSEYLTSGVSKLQSTTDCTTGLSIKKVQQAGEQLTFDSKYSFSTKMVSHVCTFSTPPH